MSRKVIQAINWAGIAERVPEHQKSLFAAYRAKSEQYIRRMLANPEQPPVIDWDYYRQMLVTPSLVDKFKKEYESYKVPFPAHKYDSQFDAEEKAVEERIMKFRNECKIEIENCLKAIAAWEAIMPYDQMTMEDFLDTHPEYETGTEAKPSIWPHTDDLKEAEEAALRGENGDDH